MVIVRRSLRLWILVPIAIAFGIFDIKSLMEGASLFDYSENSRRGGHFFGIVLASAAVAMVIYDSYVRFIRKDYLEFNDVRVVDNISKYKLGHISWQDIEGLDVQRQWLGSTVRITFRKPPESLGKRKESELLIGQLEISIADQRRIMELVNHAQK